MIKKLFTFVLTCAVAMGTMVAIAPLTACNSASLLNKVEAFEPVVLDGLNLFCAIRPSESICAPAFLSKIGSDYTTVTQLWSEYLTAVTAGTATTEAYNVLNAAFQVYENDANQIFSLISQLNNPTVSAVMAAAEVLLAAIEVMFPNAPAAGNAVSMSKPALFAAHAVGRTTYDKAWLSGWIKDFNTKVDTAHAQYPNVKLSKVHLHHFKVGTAQLGW
jgi:hypothetical protein